MRTEIEIVSPVVNPGRKIQCVSYEVRNYLVHQVAHQVSLLMLGFLESDSGNSVGQSSARETRGMWKGWTLVKAEWERLKRHRDAPWAKHEYQFSILVPHVNEIMSANNMKVQRVCWQLQQLARLLAGLDSASMQSWVGPADIGEIEELLLQTEEVLKEYWGTGAKGEGVFDTGLEMPEYKVGTLIPDLDRNAATVWEPSTEAPVSPYADAPDLESLAPKPGQKQS